MVEPQTCFRGPRLAKITSHRIGWSAHEIESRTLVAIWKLLCAAIALPGRLQPEININAWVRGIQCGRQADATSTGVAPSSYDFFCLLMAAEEIVWVAQNFKLKSFFVPSIHEP